MTDLTNKTVADLRNQALSAAGQSYDEATKACAAVDELARRADALDRERYNLLTPAINTKEA